MKNNNTKPGYPRQLTMEEQYVLIGKIVFNLNLLIQYLPIEIQITPNRKAFSDEWLKENGLEHLIMETDHNQELNDNKDS